MGLIPRDYYLGTVALGLLPWDYCLGTITLGLLPWDYYLGTVNFPQEYYIIELVSPNGNHESWYGLSVRETVMDTLKAKMAVGG